MSTPSVFTVDELQQEFVELTNEFKSLEVSFVNAVVAVRLIMHPSAIIYTPSHVGDLPDV